MKQCPRCKKEVADHAKICPYCGYRLETGYQPMERRNAPKVGIMYIFMAFIFMFSPAIIGYFFNQSDLFPASINHDSNESIMLGPIGDVGNVSEFSNYYFNDLDSFNDNVQNVEPMVTKIKNFEAELSGASDSIIESTYNIYITNLNNVYFDLTYIVNINDDHYIEIDLYYDMAEIANKVKIRSYKQNNTTFEEVRYVEEEYQLMKQIITLLNGDEEVDLLRQVGQQFNDLEPVFEKQKERLGNYGVGLHENNDVDTSSMYVFGPADNYMVKFEYQTRLDFKKFM